MEGVRASMALNRIVLWTVNAALVVLCCWIAGGLLADAAADLVVPPTTVAAGAPAPTPTPARTWQSRQAILDRNLFKASTGGYCAYGGSTMGKPFPNAYNIVFRDNVFERGPGGKCGAFGSITSFNAGASGNQWTNNTWDDGTVARSS